MRSFYLYPFLFKPRPSGVSLESPGLENIPQVPGNPAKVAQNHDARKARVRAELPYLTAAYELFMIRRQLFDMEFP